MPTKIRHLDAFLVGCGVGNREVLLPDEKAFAGKIVMSLDQLGVSEDEHIKAWSQLFGIYGALNVDREKHDLSREKRVKGFRGWLGYQVPLIMRKILSEQEYRWFKLGQLIYEPVTLKALDQPYPEVATALQAITQELHLPDPLKILVGEYIELLERLGASVSDIESFANRVAKTVSHFL